MAANPKPKRYQKDWRKKEVNHAKIKISRDIILSAFSPSDALTLKVPETLFSLISLNPVLSSASQIQCENSRKTLKHPKREKITSFKIEISKINLLDDPEIEEPQNQNFLSQLNSKREIQESYVKYSEDLFNSHLVIQNPFAEVIVKSCLKKDSIVYPQSKSFEKIWYYKDALNRTQGPFSSVEMFNWTAAGYFTTHLLLAREDPSLFFALSSYC